MTTRPVLVAVDQGTTNTKAVVVETSPEAAGTTLAHSAERVEISFPQPGWVETDPDELWRTTVLTLATVAGATERPIAAIGVSNQRETVVAWDRATGEPLGPAVSWQCTRGTALVRSLDDPEHRSLVEGRSGLGLDPMFSASKMRWLLDHIDGTADLVDAGRLAVGTVDAWLAFRLTFDGAPGSGAFVTDLTNASRTALMDLSSGDWDDDLLNLFAIPRCCLPRIVASAEVVGTVRCAELPSLAGVPIAALAGDSHAALVGHGVVGPGGLKATFGTGSSIMAPVAAGTAAAGLSRTIGWSSASPTGPVAVHALEGNIYATGAALEWTAGLLGLGGDVAALEDLARTCDHAGGVSLVPAFSGLGAPHWRPDARGTLTGLTRGAGPAQVARAAFDAVGHQVADVLDAVLPALADTITGDHDVTTIHGDGGALRSPLLAATVADLTGLTVERAEHPEVGALGAALLAGLAVGVWTSIAEVAALDRPTTTIVPTLAEPARRARRGRWAEAVAATTAGERTAP